MTKDWRITICETLDDTWVKRAPCNVGGGALHSSAHIYVLAEGPASLRFDLRYLVEDYHFKADAIVWRDWFVFGFGMRCILVSLDGARQIEIGLRPYFSDFRSLPDRLLAVSGFGIVCLGAGGETLWRNDALAIDGVVIASTEGMVITGEAEQDPPGGWRPFRISIQDGTDVP